jgi:subtilisin family serine protease
MLNVLNLSYGMFAANGLRNAQIAWTPRESSVITYAHNGAAVVVKSAGNHAIAVGGVNSSGEVDYLDRALIGADAAIFVGALVGHGTVANPTSLASFSNFAGTDLTVQNQFLGVGVRSDVTGLNGTSFAAPIVSGYAAVIGSKFTTATPVQITNQLLNTARTDTILNYSAAVHGRGEASIARALAPASIN